MQHGHTYLRGAWGQLTKVSADKGPHKIATIECDGQEIEAHIGESFGLQANPHKDALAFVLYPDGDVGKAVVVAMMPRPKDRVDQQKEGEVTLKNHDTGNSIQHDADGNTTVKTKGVFHVNPV